MLLALLSATCAGGGASARWTRWGPMPPGGLHAGPHSRRLGESLQRMKRTAREGLQECARLVGRRLVARECEQRWGYVPVFVDGTAIEVEGRLFEHAECGRNGEKQSWLPAVFGGPAWVSARLPAGGPPARPPARRWGAPAASGAGMMR